MAKSPNSESFTAEHAEGCKRITDTILSELMRLAKVPTSLETRFCNAIERAIGEANIPVIRERISSTRIGEQLNRIENDAETLRARAIASDEIVLNFINAALWEKFGIDGSILVHLDTLCTVAKSAREDAHRALAKKGRPAGLQNRFDVFVYQLVTKARSCGGKLTIYKTDHMEEGWQGSLLKAINLLKPVLSLDFPRGNSKRKSKGALGQRLDRIAKIAGRR